MKQFVKSQTFDAVRITDAAIDGIGDAERADSLPGSMVIYSPTERGVWLLSPTTRQKGNVGDWLVKPRGAQMPVWRLYTAEEFTREFSPFGPEPASSRFEQAEPTSPDPRDPNAGSPIISCWTGNPARMTYRCACGASSLADAEGIEQWFAEHIAHKKPKPSEPAFADAFLQQLADPANEPEITAAVNQVTRAAVSDGNIDAENRATLLRAMERVFGPPTPLQPTAAYLTGRGFVLSPVLNTTVWKHPCGLLYGYAVGSTERWWSYRVENGAWARLEAPFEPKTERDLDELIDRITRWRAELDEAFRLECAKRHGKAAPTLIEVHGAALQSEVPREGGLWFKDPDVPPPAGHAVTFPGMLGDDWFKATVSADQKTAENDKIIGTLAYCPVRKFWVVTVITDRKVLERVNFS